MSTVQEETKELISILPEVNSVSAYGSGYFKQDDTAGEKKSMDLIISVDNPSKWHAENLNENPEMYIGTGIQNLINPQEIVDGDNHRVSFPNSLGCFFTDFGEREYKLLVVDKRLLYDDLRDWRYFSLAGRFQKETKLLVDNSGGVLPELMKFNYESAIKAALLMNLGKHMTIEEFYGEIMNLSYLGDFRKTFHFEDPNKIANIVKGSYDFLNDVYGNSPEFSWGIISTNFDTLDEVIYKNSYNSKNLPDKISELPSALRSYLYNMIPTEIQNKKTVSKTVYKFFKDIDRQSSVSMALRCRSTVGKEKSGQTFAGKWKKGRQKVKK